MTTGCEILKCSYYKDGTCKDTNEYVNSGGDAVCGRRDDAILVKKSKPKLHGCRCPWCQGKTKVMQHDYVMTTAGVHNIKYGRQCQSAKCGRVFFA